MELFKMTDFARKTNSEPGRGNLLYYDAKQQLISDQNTYPYLVCRYPVNIPGSVGQSGHSIQDGHRGTNCLHYRLW